MKKLERAVNLRISQDLLDELDVVINGVEVKRKSNDKKLKKSKEESKGLSRNDFLLMLISKGLRVVYSDIANSDKSKYFRNELCKIEIEDAYKVEDEAYHNSICGIGIDDSEDGSEIDIDIESRELLF